MHNLKIANSGCGAYLDCEDSPLQLKAEDSQPNIHTFSKLFWKPIDSHIVLTTGRIAKLWHASFTIWKTT